MTQRRYLTTAIDFPNAAPHMGHVYEKILADALVRWWRLNGNEVRFHLGTDENGIKIQQTAKTLGMTPRELVDRNAPVFESLFRRLNVSFDFFIRTADPKSHWPTVAALWEKLKAAGYLEKRSYTGLYCTGCERIVRTNSPHRRASRFSSITSIWPGRTFWALRRDSACCRSWSQACRS